MLKDSYEYSKFYEERKQTKIKKAKKKKQILNMLRKLVLQIRGLPPKKYFKNGNAIALLSEFHSLQ